MTAFLNEKLTQCSISLPELAGYLELDVSTLEEKLNGSIPWKLFEAVQVCCLLKTNEIHKLFPVR